MTSPTDSSQSDSTFKFDAIYSNSLLKTGKKKKFEFFFLQSDVTMSEVGIESEMI